MGVALITPFKSDGSVDYNALVRLVEYQVQNGVDFLCVLGTTAETPTLTEEEKRQIKKVVIERVNGQESGDRTRQRSCANFAGHQQQLHADGAQHAEK